MDAHTFSLKNKLSIADNGFTLIEVLMAMVIFLVGFLAVGSMQISAVNGNTTARMRTSASILAGDIVEQLMRCPYDTSGGCSVVRFDEDGNSIYADTDVLADGNHPGGGGWIAEDPDGSGPDSTYQVRWTVDENADGTVKEVDVFVRWQKGGKNHSVQYTFLAADASL